MLTSNIDMLQRKITNFDNKLKSFLGDNLLNLKKNCKTTNIQLNDSEIMKLEKIIENKVQSKDVILLYEKVTDWFVHSLAQILNQYPEDVVDKGAVIQSVRCKFYQTVRKLSLRTLTFDFNYWKKKQNFKENKNLFGIYQLQFENGVYFKNFFLKFPVLFRLLENEKRKKINFIQFILDSFMTDREVFSAKMGRITGLIFDQGDAHLDGKTSTIIYMGNKKILFKPRKADMDQIYGHIVEFYNENCSPSHKIICPNNYYFEDHHWVDFIEREDCIKEVMIKSFYRDIGVQLAFIYAMNGTDFHFENIIAAGKHPILVDLECLFGKEHLKQGGNNTLLGNSVLTTHIIPTLNGLRADKYVTAIGIQDTEMNTFEKVIEDTENGNLCIGSKKKNIQLANNIPTLNGETISVENYIENVVDGFKKGYKFLCKNQEIILNDLNHRYANYQYRKLLRPTSHYAQILSMSYHPRFLMSEVDRRLFLMLIADDIFDRTIEYAEYNALLNSDIPLHTGVLNSTSINVNDTVILKDYLKITPLNAFKEKLISLNNEDMKIQMKLIRLSLKSIFQNGKFPISRDTSKCMIEEVDCVLRIEEVIHEILKPNYEDIHLNMVLGNEFNSLKAMNEGLYGGKLGYAFLTFCLYLITKKEKYKTITDDLVFRSLSTDDEFKNETSIGVFSGTSSALYMLYLLYKERKEKIYLIKAKEIIRKIMLKLDKKNYIICDIIDGISGILIILSHFGKLHPDDEAIIQDIEKLIALLKENKIQIDSDKVSWDRKLTGFSHGNSGIVYALIATLNHVENPKIDAVIEQALNYETSQIFEGGWKDNRSTKSDGDFNSWCHGSPGILLSRMALPKKYQNELTKADEALAYQNTKNIKHNSIGLCHGIIGNYLIQYKYAQHISNKKEIENTKENINRIVSDLLNLEDLNKQISSMSIDKSLMTGISGVLYSYLYVNYPNANLPFVLTLE
ncbi:hypothetical protein COL26_18925 [Bacillus thuringiensis]|uniref:Lantibiotic biosynthesis protein dehydration domain-containing protein n=1 Tax=Bacillus thuringiensis TaxID=1428 RepID=A0ABD6S3A4_BACTU|nr:type 2 lanthipeptide synthetase LanM family protein [Bacillus thuringiensis]PER51758.1 hypothetical protein CN495_17930 [Bacillus thuringiensis]PEU72023.1 hypothetical protein CN411_33120 [Bacillus thuringiensis]PFI10026.1 hypothetical protein COI79_09600 [Bacillus thuringiensis]PFW37298.1 hypothetical protein COL26_18925 [Bacillus thuringiensis]PGY64758.1 hypothetical protein COE44_30410 [Bacillus thuringiensis]